MSSWLRVHLTVPAGDLAALEALLTAHGAVAVSLADAEDQADLLEPAPGETPLWEVLGLSALFPLDTDLAALRAALGSQGRARVTDADFIGEDDWAHNNAAVDAVFGERLWLRPREARAQAGETDPRDLTPLYLAPGLAFGSGSHPTTRLCLDWLAAHVRPGQRVLDFGCGSGILAIAAALLGAYVVAVDHDPQAIVATLENAAYNGVDARVASGSEPSFEGTALAAADTAAWALMSEAAEGAFHVVVANILAAPIMALAGTFERVTAPGGQIILSGILAEQAEQVRQAFTGAEFHTHTEMDGWVCLHGVVAVP